MNQMDDCARFMLEQHMPEHYVEINDRVQAVESLLQCTSAAVVAMVGMGGVGMYWMSSIMVQIEFFIAKLVAL